jgi:hypothetical protein
MRLPLGRGQAAGFNRGVAQEVPGWRCAVLRQDSLEESLNASFTKIPSLSAKLATPMARSAFSTLGVTM